MIANIISQVMAPLNIPSKKSTAKGARKAYNPGKIVSFTDDMVEVATELIRLAFYNSLLPARNLSKSQL